MLCEKRWLIFRHCTCEMNCNVTLLYVLMKGIQFLLPFSTFERV
jgi:hypothetical protein